MIPTLLKINWINLRRDYVALGLTFVLPIIFFSTFAAIFSGSGRSDGASATKILVVDLDNTDITGRLINALDDQAALRVYTRPKSTEENPTPPRYTRDQALSLVRKGKYSAAVVFPAGFTETFGSFTGSGMAVEVIHDPANPIVLPTVSGLLQAAAMTAAPDVLMEQGLAQLEAAGGILTPVQRTLVSAFKPMLRGLATNDSDDRDDSDASSEASATGFAGLVAVRATDAGQNEDGAEAKPRAMVAYYAAGIGVMFLLFSMVNGAGGMLLEEEERGTLERLLASNVSMTSLLSGYWLFFALMGALQLTVMFTWAAVVFGLDLWTPRHFAGFAAMTIATAGASAAFGIGLGALCKSRAQLGGISTIVILIMSALGGSMVPRFIMPAFMDTTALFTLTGWALDGYLKVFWYEDPTASFGGAMLNLLPQVGMLTAMTFAFMGAARLLARRWEAA